MQPVRVDNPRYDTTTIVLHWTTACLVLAQWLGAQIIDWFPSGPMRVDVRSVHTTGGVLLGMLLVGRIVWRMTKGRRLPVIGSGFLPITANLTHIGLYILVGLMVVAGIALAWARGDSIFNLFSIPAYDPGNRALADQIQDVHATIGWLILALAGLHASAALTHRYIWHDRVLSRMLPGL
jgi:cytochrome b561